MSGDSQRTQRGFDASRVWAVVIGIDDYPTSPLRGGVSDAAEVVKYLADELHVPKNNIQCLLGSTNNQPQKSPSCSSFISAVKHFFGFSLHCNTDSINCSSATHPSIHTKSATRANIIKALLKLSDNSNIQEGDNIVIYFAGHGSCYPGSEFYNGDPVASAGHIEALCPMDRSSSVPDICDREINRIISHISDKKGHHITLIMDCCHSAGVTRVVIPGVRRADPMPGASIKAMFDAADEDLGELPGYKSVSMEDWRENMDTHVVLAACKEAQFATEAQHKGKSGYNGVFTQALLRVFRNGHLEDGSTYVDVIRHLNESSSQCYSQTAVVAGRYKYARVLYQETDAQLSNVESLVSPGPSSQGSQEERFEGESA
ncbi:peptidase C14, caspase domain-containing protein [Desarmillaria tabescens]|uniref:Peptidase C14, caspase domain-containing protein n=1 Tax=Armillaria tabescens TaxID=1929756 RepID=A0AA39N7H0_ARMTA|nr:peptidase C14, caspase domain-containing protein [Desarmillaria tabescens]KAK0460446.1 peptidase C14, caspase domain-containing protein [Desarmillaria tabescens]